MNREETKVILAVLRSAYPSFYKGMGKAELTGIVDLWAEMFRDEPSQMVAAAVKAMIATRENTFPPNIGEIKAQIEKLQNANEPSASDAWSMVATATRNGLYNAQREFDKLPPDVRAVVGTPMQLKEWAMMESDVFASVVASNFQKAYRARAERARNDRKLPSDVKALVSALSDVLTLSDEPKPIYALSTLNAQYATHDAPLTPLEQKAVARAIAKEDAS